MIMQCLSSLAVHFIRYFNYPHSNKLLHFLRFVRNFSV